MKLYQDKDGIASEKSQAAYDFCIKWLLKATLFHSFIGFTLAGYGGDYSLRHIEPFSSLGPKYVLQYSSYLWVSN